MSTEIKLSFTLTKDFAEQEMYITDAIKLQSNVADNFQLELNNDILKQLLVRLKLIY